MPERTEEELREIKTLVDSNTSYEDFPDGVTWADVDAAEQLDEKEDPDER